MPFFLLTLHAPHHFLIIAFLIVVLLTHKHSCSKRCGNKNCHRIKSRTTQLLYVMYVFGSPNISLSLFSVNGFSFFPFISFGKKNTSHFGWPFRQESEIILCFRWETLGLACRNEIDQWKTFKDLGQCRYMYRIRNMSDNKFKTKKKTVRNIYDCRWDWTRYSKRLGFFKKKKNWTAVGNRRLLCISMVFLRKQYMIMWHKTFECKRDV